MVDKSRKCHCWFILARLCTYQCKSREGGVRARGGDLIPETIPLSLSIEIEFHHESQRIFYGSLIRPVPTC